MGVGDRVRGTEILKHKRSIGHGHSRGSVCGGGESSGVLVERVGVCWRESSWDRNSPG